MVEIDSKSCYKMVIESLEDHGYDSLVERVGAHCDAQHASIDYAFHNPNENIFVMGCVKKVFHVSGGPTTKRMKMVVEEVLPDRTKGKLFACFFWQAVASRVGILCLRNLKSIALAGMTITKAPKVFGRVNDDYSGYLAIVGKPKTRALFVLLNKPSSDNEPMVVASSVTHAQQNGHDMDSNNSRMAPTTSTVHNNIQNVVNSTMVSPTTLTLDNSRTQSMNSKVDSSRIHRTTSIDECRIQTTTSNEHKRQATTSNSDNNKTPTQSKKSRQSNPSHVSPKVKKSYEYTTLDRLEGNGVYNIFGLVTKIYKVPTPTSKGCYHCILMLQDDKCHSSAAQKDLMFHIFTPKREDLPEFQIGQVIRAHRVRTEQHLSRVDARIFHGFDMVMFTGRLNETPFTCAAIFEVGPDDFSRVKELLTFNSSIEEHHNDQTIVPQEQITQQPTLSKIEREYFFGLSTKLRLVTVGEGVTLADNMQDSALVKELQDLGMRHISQIHQMKSAHVFCKLLNIYNIPETNEKVILDIEDGTWPGCTFFNYYHKEREWSPSSESYTLPERCVQVLVPRSALVFEHIQDGDFICLYDLHMLQNGEELYLQGDQVLRLSKNHAITLFTKHIISTADGLVHPPAKSNEDTNAEGCETLNCSFSFCAPQRGLVHSTPKYSKSNVEDRMELPLSTVTIPPQQTKENQQKHLPSKPANQRQVENGKEPKKKRVASPQPSVQGDVIPQGVSKQFKDGPFSSSVLRTSPLVRMTIVELSNLKRATINRPQDQSIWPCRVGAWVTSLCHKPDDTVGSYSQSYCQTCQAVYQELPPIIDTGRSKYYSCIACPSGAPLKFELKVWMQLYDGNEQRKCLNVYVRGSMAELFFGVNCINCHGDYRDINSETMNHCFRKFRKHVVYHRNRVDNPVLDILIKLDEDGRYQIIDTVLEKYLQ